MVHEDAPKPEKERSRWEFSLSWEELLISVLERKVIPADDPNYPPNAISLRCSRRFQAPDGNRLLAFGDLLWFDNDKLDESMWSIEVTPAVSSEGQVSHSYRLDIHRRGEDGDAYRVTQEGSDIPLGPEAVEALMGTIATCVAVSEPEYHWWRSAQPEQS